MGSLISNRYPRYPTGSSSSSLLIAPPHFSYSLLLLSQTNPLLLYPRSINLSLSKIPVCNPLLSSSNTSSRQPPCIATAKEKNPSSVAPSIVEQLSDDEFEDFDDDVFDDLQDDYLDEDVEPRSGDGGGGGGICLAGTAWDKEALTIAQQVCMSFNGDLGIYAFKTLQNSAIRLRIERLSNKSGSPTMEDIEAFSKAYREQLNQAEAAGSIPVDISIEVSSPGLERVIRIPQDLDRFKDRTMYVKYMAMAEDDDDDACERDGVLRLESYNMETKTCSWGLADVRVNREKAGKGRPLNKKQREWRLVTPFHSLLLVRIYADL